MFFNKPKKKETKAMHLDRAKVELKKLTELLCDAKESINKNGNGSGPDTTEILYASICKRVLGRDISKDETQEIVRTNNPRSA